MLDKLPADPAAPTLVAKVMAMIQARIEGRLLGPGAKLPSVRGLAATLQVSKSTVVEAYDRLCAEGAIVARRGSGFFVAGPARPLSLAALAPPVDRQIDPLWLMRQALEVNKDALSPGSGWLPASWMPEDSMQRELRHFARELDLDRMRYDEPFGHLPLRQYLSRRLGERGIAADPGQILITDSATHALDLVFRFLLTPGDKVLVDDPCYFNFLALLRAHRVEAIGVPYTPQGPDTEAFGAALATHKPRLYLTNSTFHNPTGATLTPVVAHRLLKLAESHDCLIVEDDIFADFDLESTARLAAFDGLDRVIHVGSFTKTLSAAIRCGYIALRGDWVEPLVDLKLATTLGNGHVAAALTRRLLIDGSYRRHVEGLRNRLADAMGLTIRRLEAIGLKPWLEPRGGMFLWARLPQDLDAADIARKALSHDVILAPGDVFSASHSATAYLRFNVARSTHPRIFEVLCSVMSQGGA